MIRHVSAYEAKGLVHGGGEIAFLDLREAGPFSEGHPLFAIPCPFSTLEARVGALVPNPSVPVLLMDGGDGFADVAAAALSYMGYGDLSVLAGGAEAWMAAGYTLYKGVNVPSKALGELVEQQWHPRMLTPEVLKSWQDDGRDFQFVDCRPPGEFTKMTVPGARCLPNGEVAHRLPSFAEDVPLVLTCAGRTRGVIGVAGLSRIAPGREIYALENGTQGWRLAGYDLLLGNEPAPYPVLDAAGRQKTKARAAELLAAEGIPAVPAQDVRGMLADGARTTFLIDVRSGEEAAEDPLPAFDHALSGQLVQATDQWIGVRHARVVLADDLGMRAALAAFWLRKLGYEAHVALIDDDLRGIVPPERPAWREEAVPTCPAREALKANRTGTGRFLDARRSASYCAGHVVGAQWVNRSYLSRLPSGPRFLVIGDGAPRATLVVREMRRLGHRDVVLVEGGHDALVQAGAGTEASPHMRLSDRLDLTSFAHGRHDGDLAASRLYLEWEQGLVAQLDSDERTEFGI